MKKLFITITITTLFFVNTLTYAAPITLTGSGSTNIYPLMTIWIKSYQKINPGVKVEYSASGSGMGMKMLQDRTVSFAATEMPISQKLLKRNNWLQFPIAISPVEIVYNLPGVSHDKLVLKGSVIADIYMGKIKFWDAPAIKAINPKLALPHHKINVIYRSNPSGTTYAFSHFLGQISMKWEVQDNGNLLLDNLVKGSIGVNSNAALARVVKATAYSIGYCDYSYAYSEGLSMASLISQTAYASVGYLIRPGLLSAYAALYNNNHAISLGNLTNLPGINSWPILMATYILLPVDNKLDKYHRVLIGNLHFFLWALIHGSAYTTDLQYIPMPSPEFRKVISYWKQVLPTLDDKKLLKTVLMQGG